MLAYDASREALYQPERRPTLFVEGRDLPIAQVALEAARLAYVRAETAVSETARLNDALARVGFGAATLFVHPATGTFGFGCVRSTDGTRLVAFRGTQPDDLDDLVSDLDFLAVDWPETGGRVHRGFANAVRGLLPAVREWLAGSDNGSLILCGHSLGAAIATLAAALLKPTQLITLGSPRVGDAAFANATADVAGARFVDCADIVTTVPPAIFGYVHVRAPSYIDAAGQIHQNPTNDLMQADARAAGLAYTKERALIRGNVLLRSFADHAPINYLRAFDW
jgi:pimeloyl-ACP methyl ester carboxylesterase